LLFARTDSDLDTVAQNIIAKMTNNPNFPNASPKLEDVIKASQTYTSLLVDAKNRDRAKIALKRSAKNELTEILTALANYVMSVAKGNEAILTSSGFVLAKKRGSAPLLINPQKFVVRPGLNKGEIATEVERIPGARSYVHEYTLDPLTDASVWTSVASAYRKHLFTNLQSGKTYWFRVAAVGPNGQIVYSASQAHIVL
jgi:hypothetical protein